MQKSIWDLCCTKGVHETTYSSEILWLLVLIHNVFLQSSLPCKELLWLPRVLHRLVRAMFKPCQGSIAAKWLTINNFQYGILAWNSLKASVIREQAQCYSRSGQCFPKMSVKPFLWRTGHVTRQVCKQQSFPLVHVFLGFFCVSVFLELYVWN